MRRLLIRLYPARWRARYGDEFEAVLEERTLGPFDVADILLGALDAHLRLRGRAATTEHGRSFTMSLRIGGFAAILAGILWTAGIIAVTGFIVEVEPIVPSVAIAAGSVAMLVALAGLSAFQARVHPVLSWVSFAVPAVGTIVSFAGLVGIATLGDRPMVGDLSAWYVWVLGMFTALAGSALFAITTYRTGALSRTAALVLGSGSVLAFVMLLAPNVGAPVEPASVIAVGGLIGVLIGWCALGLDAIRLDRMSASPRPA